VRDGVLRELVEAQLWNPSLSIKEIALGVGFADVASFSKAFRRWTGQAPTRFRERVLSRAARRRGPARRVRAT
jgi:AraC-like DNA-binding protein